MVNRLARNVVNVDLFTDAYRVTGRATIHTSGGLHAELASANSSFLNLEDAYISRIHQPGEIVASYGTGAFRKDNINFLILQDRRDGIPAGAPQARSMFSSRGRPLDCFISVPAFEIQGEMNVVGKPNPRDLVINSPGNFLLVFGAKASAAAYPDISYSGDLILVQKERIGILAFAHGT